MNTKDNQSKIVASIASDLMRGARLMVKDAAKYGSSETGFPRRIMDIEEKFGVKVKIDKVKLPNASGGVTLYSQYYLV